MRIANKAVVLNTYLQSTNNKIITNQNTISMSKNIKENINTISHVVKAEIIHVVVQQRDNSCCTFLNIR